MDNTQRGLGARTTVWGMEAITRDSTLGALAESWKREMLESDLAPGTKLPIKSPSRLFYVACPE